VEVADGPGSRAASFGGVPETGARGVEGELVRVGRGGRKQLDRLDVGGKVALVEWQVARLWPYHVGLELGLRGAKAMVLYAPEGGPFYQAPTRSGPSTGSGTPRAPPCVTIRREDAPKLEGPRAGRAARAAQAEHGWNVVGELPAGARRARRSSPATTTAGSRPPSTTRPASR
jgi:hypothetical protein